MLLDSLDSIDYNQFVEMALAENSNQNISINDENISIKKEIIESAPHDATIKEEYKFKCNYCGKAFKLARDLRDHTAAIHTGQTFYQCPFCTTKCKEFKNIRRHIKNLHPKEYVEVGYDKVGELNKLYTNLNEKPIYSDDDTDINLKCPYCRSKVSHAKNLVRHIKTLHPEKIDEYLLKLKHLKEKKEEIESDNAIGYKCPYCRKILSHKRNVRRHIKLVHPEKYVEPSVDVPKVDLNLLGNQADKNESVEENAPNYDDYDAFIAKWREVLECELCKKTFNNFGLLRTHFREEHPSEKCHVLCCQYKIPSRIRLVDHIRFHLDPNSFKCQICEKCFPTSIALNSHKHSHDGKKPHQCSVCGKCFRFREKLVLHSGLHSSETNYFCNVCEKGFPTEALLKKHGYIHTRITKHLCDHCGKCCQSHAKLQEHIVQHIDIENPNSKWSCDGCSASFDSRENLSEHTNSCLPAKTKWTCDVCSTSFNSRINLEQHKKLYHPDTVYVCSECGNKFRSKAYLKLHKKRNHEKRVKYECPMCNKELVSSQALRVHISTHDGNAPHQCPYCSLTLKHKKNIPRHVQLAHPVEFSEMKKRKRAKVDLSLIDNQIVL